MKLVDVEAYYCSDCDHLACRPASLCDVRGMPDAGKELLDKLRESAHKIEQGPFFNRYDLYYQGVTDTIAVVEKFLGGNANV